MSAINTETPPDWWDRVVTTPAGSRVSSTLRDNLPIPSLCYSAPRLREVISRLRTLAGGTPETRIAYAVKACALHPLLALVAEEGLGAEIQSWHEAKLATATGFDPRDLIWNGPLKDATTLTEAVTSSVVVIVDNISEGRDLLTILKQQQARGHKNLRWGVRVALQHSNPESSFTRRTDKLGMDLGDACSVVRSGREQGTPPTILHVHAVARISNQKDYAGYILEIARIHRAIQETTGLCLPTIDVGGGWETPSVLAEHGCSAAALVETAVAVIRDRTDGDSVKSLVFEPGRHIVEDAAFALARVIRKKSVGGRHWLIVDLSTNLLIPLPLARYRASTSSAEMYTAISIADGTCSPSGVLVSDADYASAQEGSVIVISHCGAYSAALAEPFYGPPAPIYWCEHDNARAVVAAREMETATALMTGLPERVIPGPFEGHQAAQAATNGDESGARSAGPQRLTGKRKQTAPT